MSLFPSPFLAKLQDLKLWQGNYEALLQNKSSEINSPSDFDTIEGLSALDSTRSSISMTENEIANEKVDWDKRVVTPSKPFEQLLEEKLAEDEPVIVPFKPKKPYLKKGAGLVRYRMTFPRVNGAAKTGRKLVHKKNPHSVQSKISVNKISPRHKSCFKSTITTNTENSSDAFSATPLKMPDIGMKPKGVWVKVHQDDMDGIEPLPEASEGSGSKQSDKHGKFMQKFSQFAMKHFLPSSPKKHSALNKSQEKSASVDHQKIQSTNLENSERELQVFELLEERLEHGSFSSNNSSILKLLSSTPSRGNKHSKNSNSAVQNHQSHPHDNVHNAGHYQNSITNKILENNKKQDVLQHFLSNLKHMVDQEEDEVEHRRPMGRMKKMSPDTTFSESETNTDTRSPTSSSFYTEFENTFKSNIRNRIDVAVNTSFSEKEESVQSCAECQNCAELKQQLNKLMKEIPDIQGEKARVCDFAKDLERKRDLLNRDMQKMKENYEKDIGDLRAELEAEKKKFLKEKAIFDMYIKDSQNRSTRKEREDLSMLKKELTDTKELMKLKETKNGATHARLRNQIKSLEKERDELKTSVENLQKENSKLNATRRIQRPSEVKMLHEINKNLTKLTEETLKKQFSNSDLLDNVSSRDLVRKGSKKEVDEEENDENDSTPKAKSNKRQNSSKTRNSIEKTNVSSTNVSTGTREFSNMSLEERYETTFGQGNGSEHGNSSHNESKKDRVETVFPDGSKEVKYSNGNTKIVSPDGNIITVRYYNSDIKEINLKKNCIKYFYFENSTWHTQFGDGTELLEYASGQKEKKFKDGKKEITSPDGTLITKLPDGTEEILFPDGSKMIQNTNGEKILLLPNGQKEIHTGDHKRREYPDGTIKILYADGSQKTRYASGRVRVRDANGVLIMDTNENDG